MSKKKQRAIKNQKLSTVRVETYMKDMKLKDLQRECILRGMGFEEMAVASILQLSSWLIDNFERPRKRDRLKEFDDWMNERLEKNGKHDLIHPMLDLSYSRDEKTGKKKQKRIKGLRREVVKKERTEDGIFSGTKKAFTYKLTKEGKTKQEVIELVIEQFPEAKEKSIGIWYNKAKKLIK